jgi:hypothetical protein
MAVLKRHVHYFSKGFGLALPYLETAVEDTSALVCGRRGAFWRHERATTPQHVAALAELSMLTIGMLLPLQHGR